MQTLPLQTTPTSTDAQTLHYAPPARPTRRMRIARIVLAVTYAIAIVLPFGLIALIGHLPPAAIVVTFLLYAFALLPTFHLDHWLFGGAGFHSPVAFILLTLCTAVMLWPLPLLSIAPGLWPSRPWRRAILAYAAIFLLSACAAAWQMTRTWAEFFG